MSWSNPSPASVQIHPPARHLAIPDLLAWTCMTVDLDWVAPIKVGGFRWSSGAVRGVCVAVLAGQARTVPRDQDPNTSLRSGAEGRQLVSGPLLQLSR